ncbi:hypothetical protein FRB96_000715 [Tulasnella sp. 330]|nr:hypothetical protein FRB96_000715 [Tulasnella sp. 330]KAG8887164.1 hypothetical protein FRB98_000420 [Tulasnella sp. 332]
MHSEPTKVLFIGATGYIGGSILVAFSQKHPEFCYAALVRNPGDNTAIEKLDVRIIQGSTSDIRLIESEVSEHDIIVNCANADDLSLAKAIVDGLSRRVAGSGKKGTRKPMYIHTSGTGVVKDQPTGAFQGGKIYDDDNEEDIRSIGPNQPHRNVDLLIFNAGDTGAIETYIIAPSTIYGTGRGPVRNSTSRYQLAPHPTKLYAVIHKMALPLQVNGMIRIALKEKEVLRVGAGTNEWNNVHIDDLMDLYTLVLDLALSDTRIPNSSYARFFWGSAHTHVWGEVAKDLAVFMYRKGLVDSDEVKSVTVSEYPELIGVATNSRTVANRGLRVLGWKPTGRSLKETLEEEIDLTLSQTLR